MYLIFAYDGFYPSGGWNDYEGTENSYEEAVAFAKGLLIRYDLAEIVDLNSLTRIELISKKDL